MKGIILAGGSGTRLYPATSAICKQLLPIYDKPMIYYPLSTFMMAGIREILLISTPEDTPRFERLFGNGKSLGLQISYAVQANPRGLADAFIVGASFVGNNPVALILGDNLFYGNELPQLLAKGMTLTKGGLIFGYEVRDPERYGVVEFDANGRAISIEEKPSLPKSRFAVPGLYFYGPEVVSIAKNLKPSKRGEIEITDIHQILLQEQRLTVEIMGRGFAWLDTGTFDALQKAASFVQAIQDRQGIQVGCIEEIAYKNGWISKDLLILHALKYKNNDYGAYLTRILDSERAVAGIE